MKGEDTAERKRSLDQAFFIHRHYLEENRSWADFNRSTCPNNSSQTLVGHMPIILAPVHEYETLNTVVVKRCMAVLKHFNQKTHTYYWRPSIVL